MIIKLLVVLMCVNIIGTVDRPYCRMENGNYDEMCVEMNEWHESVEGKIYEVFINQPEGMRLTREQVDKYCRRSLEKGNECYIR